MQFLVYLLFASIFLLDFLERYDFIVRQMTWIPELLSMVALLIVLLRASRQKVVFISFPYLILFLMIGLHILLGVILNNTPLFALFSGIRAYFRYLPFFLLPAVFAFSETDMAKQLKLLLIFSILQLPVALYQRFIESAGLLTGDYVGGTLQNPAHLSTYLLCAVSFVIAFYLKKRLSLGQFCILLVILFLPTTLNESKGSLILLPFALLAPVFFLGRGKKRLKNLMGIGLIGIVFLSVFIPVYDHFMKPRWGYGIVEFFTTEGRVLGYLKKSERKIEEGKEGRIDSIILSYEALSKDPVKLVFGFGIGNVSKSFLGDKFAGEYNETYGELKGPTLPHLLWEIGYLGAAFMIVFCFLILRDALYLRNQPGLVSAIGLGWASVMIVFMVALMYKNMIYSNVLGYLSWYFSGYVMATAVRFRAFAHNPLSTIEQQSSLHDQQRKRTGLANLR